MAPGKKQAVVGGSYGIAEWYGRSFRSLSHAERIEFSERARNQVPCRFMQDTPALAPVGGANCNKQHGVCSICSFENAEAGQFGPISATCPFRFLEDGLIVREIGKALLGTEHPKIAKEVPFLKRRKYLPMADDNGDVKEGADPGIASEDVGRIDMVCVHPDVAPLHWCAVEMQAVYFSGGKMSEDIAAIKNYTGNGLPIPAARRRPDFRSSGPKRLMPQLQIKVPTLRRWGKRMAVVVDRPFFNSFGEMQHEADVSNADIAWIIVDFDTGAVPGLVKMKLHDIKFTTLESAVVGLTAGVPSTLPEFEQKIREKLRN